MVAPSCTKPHASILSAEGENCCASLCGLDFTWDFSFRRLALYVCKFARGMLPEMRERCPFSNWCHLSQTGSCRLVGSTVQLLRSPNLSWFMNSLQNLPPSFFVSGVLPTWNRCAFLWIRLGTFPVTLLWSGSTNWPRGRLSWLPPWATKWFLSSQTLQFAFFLALQ